MLEACGFETIVMCVGGEMERNGKSVMEGGIDRKEERNRRILLTITKSPKLVLHVVLPKPKRNCMFFFKVLIGV